MDKNDVVWLNVKNIESDLTFHYICGGELLFEKGSKIKREANEAMFLTLYCIISGQMNYHLHRKPEEIRVASEGDILLFPKGCGRSLEVLSEQCLVECVAIEYIYQHNLDYLRLFEIPPHIKGLKDDKIIESLRNIREAILNNEKGHSLSLLHHMEGFRVLNELFPYFKVLENKKIGQLGRLEPSIELIEQSLDSFLSREEMARSVKLSTTQFNKVFKETYGVSPMAYFNQRKMEYAGSLLLRTGRNIQQIADDLGFSNAFNFSRSFKKHTGFSPRQFIANKNHLKGNTYP